MCQKRPGLFCWSPVHLHEGSKCLLFSLYRKQPPLYREHQRVIVYLIPKWFNHYPNAAFHHFIDATINPLTSTFPILQIKKRGSKSNNARFTNFHFRWVFQLFFQLIFVIFHHFLFCCFACFVLIFSPILSTLKLFYDNFVHSWIIFFVHAFDHFFLTP